MLYKKPQSGSIKSFTKTFFNYKEKFMDFQNKESFYILSLHALHSQI